MINFSFKFNSSCDECSTFIYNPKLITSHLLTLAGVENEILGVAIPRHPSGHAPGPEKHRRGEKFYTKTTLTLIDLIYQFA